MSRNGFTPNGFTLVELLAAMTAGALLLALASTVIADLAGQTRRSGAEADMIADLASAEPILRSLIQSAAPAAEGSGQFRGTQRRLSLDVPAPQALGDSGPMRLALTVEDQDDGAALVATLAPLRPGAAPSAAMLSDRRLAGGFKDIAFGYVPWPEEMSRALPALIRIRFTGQDDRQLSLAFAPRLTSDGACRFDPISLGCRP